MGLPFEILIIDDNSADGFRKRNRALTGSSHIRYLQLEENIGRARIRNMLAAKASFENLLFIDADARIMRGDYLSVYTVLFGQERVICGGTAYDPEPPGDSAYRLRWQYGREREARSAQSRSRDPYRSFSSFQFLATRDILRKVPFRQELRAYGHEDTAFGLELERSRISVVHIDNPLVHEGLEPAGEFLEKTRQGLRNLKWLWETGEVAGLEQGVRVLNRYRAFRRRGLQNSLKWIFKTGERWMQRELTGRKPRLVLFDLYKLCYFASLH
jgi:glycosyltransferase involved in cell wall biosynthesis